MKTMEYISIILFFICISLCVIETRDSVRDIKHHLNISEVTDET